MRIIIQRVVRGAVTVQGNTVGKIGRGLVVLVGIQRDDNFGSRSNKLLNARLWPDANDKAWAKSAKDLNYEVLLVSQFTLYGTLLKGNKPDYHNAMGPQPAKELYQKFVDLVKSLHSPDKVQEGEFGAMMEVEIINDGPVTLQLDSRKFTYDEASNSNSNKKMGSAKNDQSDNATKA